MIYYNFFFKYIFSYSHIFLNISEIKKSYTLLSSEKGKTEKIM